MKYLKPKTTFLIALILISVSCSQIIDIDIPEHEPVWTFNGTVRAGDNFYERESPNSNERIFSYFNTQASSHDDVPKIFSLSKTIPVKNRNNVHTFYDDGVFVIFQGDNLVETPQTSDDIAFNIGPRYISEHEYEPGETYLFQMTTNDNTELRATQTMPKKVQPRDVQLSESSTEYIVRFIIDDPIETNHYLIQCYEVYYGSFGNSATSLEYNITSPNFFWYDDDFDFFEDGNPYRFTGVLSDVAFNGQAHEIEMRIKKNNFTEGMTNDKELVIEINSMSLDMHRYFQSYIQASIGFTPFSEPVVLNFNVDNGFGAVVAVTTTFLDIEIP